MKKTFSLTFALFIFSLSAFSQVQCSFDDVHSHLKQTNPKYAQALQEMAIGMQLLQEGGHLNHSNNPSRAVRTIPVVVHVVLNTQAKQNTITDAKIINMINSANTYFRKTASLSGLRSAFSGVAADTEIELCLAQRDPNGNATNGITRLLTSTATFDNSTDAGANAMKSSSTGGVNPWNPQKYLNVWVVDLAGSSGSTGGTGGYAYLPTIGMPGSSKDGIVLEYEVGFWSPGSTLAHETGHYLGLFHTWGEDQGCPSSGNATFANGYDDGFSDTPDSEGPNMTKTCGSSNVLSCGASAPGDQYENLMDYSNCPLIFTNQQSALMNIILNGSGLTSPFSGYFGYRSSLVTNNLACVPTNGPTPSFTASSTGICTGGTVTYTNTTTGATSVSWSFPGGTPSSSTSTTSVTVTYNTPGSYNVSLTATNASGSNTTTQSNYISVGGAGSSAQLPLSQGFDATTFPPTGWTLDNIDGSTTWGRTTAGNGGYSTSTASVSVQNYNYQAPGQKDWLISPAYDFTSATNGRLKFDYAYRYYGSPSYSDTLEILYSVCGGSWTSLWYRGGSSLSTTTAGQAQLSTPTAAQWKTDSVNLAALTGQPSVRFAFVNINGYGNNLFLDNINIYNGTQQSGTPPTANFSASATSVCAGSSITFTNTSVNGGNWSWSFGGGGSPNTSTAQSPTIMFNTAGTYSVSLTATNASGSNTKTITITVNPRPSVAVNPTPVSCYGSSTGSATALVSGGTPNYSYSWTGGGASATISNKAAGSYTVTVTDSKGCTTTASGTVTQPSSALTVSINKTNANCGNLGSAEASATGGTAGYTYQWSNGTTGSSVSVSAGTYIITVTDANLCTTQGSVAITESNLHIVSSSTTPAIGGQANGTATVVVSGAEPITYSWDNGMTGSSISGLISGSYECNITDANGCTTTVKVNVDSDGTSIETLREIEKIALFPNPAQNQIQLDVQFRELISFSYSVFDVSGRELMQSPVYSGKKHSEVIPVNTWASGTYTIQLKTNKGIQMLKFIKQ